MVVVLVVVVVQLVLSPAPVSIAAGPVVEAAPVVAHVGTLVSVIVFVVVLGEQVEDNGYKDGRRDLTSEGSAWYQDGITSPGARVWVGLEVRLSSAEEGTAVARMLATDARVASTDGFTPRARMSWGGWLWR
jgi:hypothetical protein